VSLAHRGRGRRWAIDALIGVASLTVALALVVVIDSQTGNNVARAVRATPNHGQVAAQLRDDTMTTARSMWEMARANAPLATFAGVGAILVLFMIRTK
jgi:hypothetical protein